MQTPKYTLLLRLKAPLQSWGTEASKYDDRDTALMPTKSGVIGLICAAFGVPRGEDISALTAMRFGVRTDRKGTIITDFQTNDMGARYIKKFPEFLDKSYNSRVIHRKYLSDACFVAGLESPDKEALEEIVEAITYPVYALYLGRRCCLPELPIVTKNSIVEVPLEDALADAEWQAPHKLYPGTVVKLAISVEADGGGIVRDNPVSYCTTDRKYSYRKIKAISPKIITAPKVKEDQKTGHDAFAEL